MLFLLEEKDFNISSGVSVLYFYASWMMEHKKMSLMIDKIQDKYKDIKFLAIDCDHFKNICARNEVSSIPCFIIFINNKEEKRLNGIMLTSAFKSIFADIYSKYKNGDKNDKK